MDENGKPAEILHALRCIEEEVKNIRKEVERIENDRPRNAPVLEAYPWEEEPTETDAWKYRWEGDTGTWWPAEGR